MAANLTLGQSIEAGGQSFSPAGPRLLPRIALLCILSCVLSPLAAQALQDPTQPPLGLFERVGRVGGAASASSVRMPPANTGLQSVIISSTRRAAIINGTTVELGEKIGGARLVEVNEQGVVLQGAQGKRMLALFPGLNLKTSDKHQAQQKSANEAVEYAVPKEKK